MAGDTFACNFCHLLLEGQGGMTESSHIRAEEATEARSDSGKLRARQFSFLRHISGTAQSSFLILTLTEISKAGVKHTYLGQIALTRREPLATDDACLIDRAGGL